MRKAKPLFCAKWTIENPYHFEATPVPLGHICHERVTAREVEVYAYSEEEAKQKCKRRRDQWRTSPKRFTP